MIQREGIVLSLTGRLTVTFVLDVANLSRLTGDLLDTVLLTAVLQANQSALRPDPALQRRYGEAAMLDEERRPISVHALAQSLSLPFETVRRRAAGLTAAGLCSVGPAGLYVPHALVTSPMYLDSQGARVTRLGTFVEALAAAGLIDGIPDLPDTLAAHPRAADRLLGDYVLRAADRLIRLAGSAQDGLVLLALWAADSHLAMAAEAGDLAAVSRPVSGGAVAKSLRISLETARRRLGAQERLGYARKVAGGWRLAWPELDLVGQVRRESFADLRRLLIGLEQLRAE